MSSQIQVRKLDSLLDQHLGRNVFDQTWAMDSGTEITPNLLQAMVHSGSYLSGTLLGFNAHWYWLGGLIAGLLVTSVAASRLKLPDRPTADMQR